MSVTIRVFDPATCCPTGVCGPSIDPELTGVSVERFDLSQQPAAFAGTPAVQQLLAERGTDCLPPVLGALLHLASLG